MSNLRTDAALALLFPGFAAKIKAAQAAFNAEGGDFVIVSGLRTPAEQNALYAQGRNGAPGHIVTNAMAGKSNHNYGLAADIVPFLKGSSGDVNWKVAMPQYQRMVEMLKAQGLKWGGDWKGNLGDFDHFQMAGIPASPSPVMFADYRKIMPAQWEKHTAIALCGVWAHAVQGLYTEAV